MSPSPDKCTLAPCDLRGPCHAEVCLVAPQEALQVAWTTNSASTRRFKTNRHDPRKRNMLTAEANTTQCLYLSAFARSYLCSGESLPSNPLKASSVDSIKNRIHGKRTLRPDKSGLVSVCMYVLVANAWRCYCLPSTTMLGSWINTSPSRAHAIDSRREEKMHPSACVQNAQWRSTRHFNCRPSYYRRFRR